MMIIMHIKHLFLFYLNKLINLFEIIHISDKFHSILMKVLRKKLFCFCYCKITKRKRSKILKSNSLSQKKLNENVQSCMKVK